MSRYSDYNKRILAALLLALMCVASFYLLVSESTRILYLNAKGNLSDLWRLAWMLPFLLLGLFIRAYRYRYALGPPFVAYTRYLLHLAIVFLLMFVMCHSFLNMDNWLYYPVTMVAAVMFPQPKGLIEKMQDYVYNFFKFGENNG